ncbi:hypothetical protein SOVF_141510 [Spinacia oleracea]|nr:hypothetical protein SOVF_141510 [Spinacia oleracea]
MYYKKRPELIQSVEESYRAYRALAERFDHISKDLQSANRAIAAVFPEQVQMSVESDEEDSLTGSTSSPSPSPDRLTTKNTSPKNFPKAPKPPTPRSKNAKAQAMLASRREQLRKNLSTTGTVLTANSGLSKKEAFKEIDNFEKEILVMQTEKEFMKSKYESSLAKFLELESKITESQTKVCNLQDEFGFGAVIEDYEARTLMEGSALSSCAKVLANLQEEQERSIFEVKEEYKRIKEAHDRIEDLKKQCGSNNNNDAENCEEDLVWGSGFKETLAGIEGTGNVDELREKIKEQLKYNSSKALTEPEMAENIDNLVDKVVCLESTVCSQNALVKRLRDEIDGLFRHIKSFEEQKEELQEDSVMRKRLRELEDELVKIKSYNKEVADKKNSIVLEITGASCNLDHLQEKLHDVKPFEGVVKSEQEVAEIIQKEQQNHSEKENSSEKENYCSDSENHQNEVMMKEVAEEEESTIETELQLGGEEDGINWRQLYMNNMEERERILVEEYTVILRDYKDMKVKLSEMEKKSRDNVFELATLVKDLRDTNDAKDEEIQVLRKKLSAFEGNGDDEVTRSVEKCDIKPEEEEDRSDNKEIIKSSSSDPERKPLFHHLYGPDGLINENEDENENEKENENKVTESRVKIKEVSRTENRFRAELDNLLEANLDFWLRFSTAFHQIRKFQTSIKDLQTELSKLKKQGTDHLLQYQVKSDARPLYKHLREIQTELTLWLEHSGVFQEELRGRFSSLNNIQKEITQLWSTNTKQELSDYQSAKFQGEILNMKHENSKVAEELQAGVQRVKALKFETGKALMRLDKEFGVSDLKFCLMNPSVKPRIPLHTFLFGIKLKKQKKSPAQSIFSCVTSRTLST